MDGDGAGQLDPTTILAVPGVRVIELTAAADGRGRLAAGEVPGQIPFDVARFFTVYGVPDRRVRGEHAHRECHQFLVCVAGSVKLTVDDGVQGDTMVLDRPTLGVHLPPMVWGTQHDYSPDAVLLVLASHAYDPDDYVRDYAEFLALAVQR